MTDKPFHLPPERPSRLAWWLHPKVALPLTLLTLILLGPFLYRSYRISQLPDIGDPFDVEAFGTVTIPPGENAMEQYAVAVSLLHGTIPSGDHEKAFENGWSDASDDLRKWLHDNEPALVEWRKGTDRSQAVLIQPKDLRIDTEMGLIHELSAFRRLTLLKADECRESGDVEAAWSWLRASVRASRHYSQNGVLIQRLVGMANYNYAALGINRWAADMRVNGDLLQKAMTELVEDDVLMPANSVAMKCEYLMLMHTFDHISAEDLEDWGVNELQKIPKPLRRSALFLLGEPEYSRRLLKLVFQNWLSEIDKPNWQRAPCITGSWMLFDKPSGSKISVPVAELQRKMNAFSLASLALPAYQQVDQSVQREAARHAALKLTLAAQCYYRLHNDWPATLEDLVPEIIKELPADPFGKSDETLRLKRDGDDLLIYSLAVDGIDDGGVVAPLHSNTSPDEGYRLKRP